jgi:phosphohistidine phosphatase SixA
MQRLLSRCLLFLFCSPLAWAQAPASAFIEKELSQEQFNNLRQGGFVIYMRHGKTDNSKPDQLNVDLNDCTTQRPLNDEGRKMATDIGKAIKSAKIPLGETFVSPMCRARESAQLVLGAKFTVIEALYSSTNQTSEQKKPVIAATRRLLSEPVATGSNRFILAHAPNLADTMGYFPKMEATVVIFIPKGNSFEYVGSIRPDMWNNLLH